MGPNESCEGNGKCTGFGQKTRSVRGLHASEKQRRRANRGYLGESDGAHYGPGKENFVLNGDFNAETEAWIKKSGRTQLEEDVVYQGVIEDLNLITSKTKDHTFERARTQIDNILLQIELLHTLQTAHTAIGEKDHRMVVARLAWKVKGAKGESRPTRRCTSRFQAGHWQRYEQILTERIREI
eukprot:202821-Pleurochrysis_carterae.AAC.2